MATVIRIPPPPYQPPLQRELFQSRRQLETLRWLIDNASPAAWAQGLRAFHEAKKSDFCNLVYCVRRAMPVRVPTWRERTELRALIAEAFSPGARRHAYRMALANPPWFLQEFRRFVRDYGRFDQGGA
jgi:hypothetical protein